MFTDCKFEDHFDKTTFGRQGQSASQFATATLLATDEAGPRTMAFVAFVNQPVISNNILWSLLSRVHTRTPEP